MKYLIILLSLLFVGSFAQGQTLYKLLERKKGIVIGTPPHIDTYSNEATRFFPNFKPTVWSKPGSFNSFKEVGYDYEQGCDFSTIWSGGLRRPLDNALDLVNVFWYWRAGDSIHTRTADYQIGGNGIPGTGFVLAIRHDNNTIVEIGPGINHGTFAAAADNYYLNMLDNEGPASWGADNYHNIPSAIVPYIWGGNHGFHGVSVTQIGGTTLGYADVGWTGHDKNGHVWHVAHRDYGNWYLISDNKSVDGGISFLYADSLEGTWLYHDSLGVHNTDSFQFTKIGDIDRLYTLTDFTKAHYYENGKLVTNDSQFYHSGIYSFQQCELVNFRDPLEGLRWTVEHRPVGGWTINPPLNHGSIVWSQYCVLDYQEGGGVVIYMGIVLRRKIRLAAYTNLMDNYGYGDIRDVHKRYVPGLDSVNDGAKGLQYSVGMNIKDTFFNADKQCYKDVWHDSTKPPMSRFDYVTDVIEHAPFTCNFNMLRVPVMSLDSPLRQQEYKTALELFPTRKDYQHDYYDTSLSMQDSGFTRRYVSVGGWWKRPASTGKINEITYRVDDTLYYNSYFDKPGTYSLLIPPGKTFHRIEAISSSNVTVSGSIITVSAMVNPVYWMGYRHDYGYLGGCFY